MWILGSVPGHWNFQLVINDHVSSHKIWHCVLRRFITLSRVWQMARNTCQKFDAVNIRNNYSIDIVLTVINELCIHIMRNAVLQMMTTTSLLKSVGPMPLVNTQYLSTATLVKPVVVVSTPSALPPHTNSGSWGVIVIACSQQAGGHNSVIVSVCDQTFNSSSTNVVLSALERGCCETAQIENLWQRSWLSVPTP